MGSYRCKLDIIADILTVATRKPKKTQIMYQANLSFRVLQKYLAEISGASLICFEDETQCYALTVKGQRVSWKLTGSIQRQTGTLRKLIGEVNSKKQILENLFIPVKTDFPQQAS